jgi:hypothetical protein
VPGRAGLRRRWRSRGAGESDSKQSPGRHGEGGSDRRGPRARERKRQREGAEERCADGPGEGPVGCVRGEKKRRKEGPRAVRERRKRRADDLGWDGKEKGERKGRPRAGCRGENREEGVASWAGPKGEEREREKGDKQIKRPLNLN